MDKFVHEWNLYPMFIFIFDISLFLVLKRRKKMSQIREHKLEISISILPKIQQNVF